jgi:hypothetical protein
MANELVVHCPTCQIVSQPFKQVMFLIFSLILYSRIKYKQVHTECLVKLATIEQGWPAKYKFCQNVQGARGVTDCDALDNK